MPTNDDSNDAARYMGADLSKRLSDMFDEWRANPDPPALPPGEGFKYEDLMKAAEKIFSLNASQPPVTPPTPYQSFKEKFVDVSGDQFWVKYVGQPLTRVEEVEDQWGPTHIRLTFGNGKQILLVASGDEVYQYIDIAGEEAANA